MTQPQKLTKGALWEIVYESGLKSFFQDLLFVMEHTQYSGHKNDSPLILELTRFEKSLCILAEIFAKKPFQAREKFEVPRSNLFSRKRCLALALALENINERIKFLPKKIKLSIYQSRNLHQEITAIQNKFFSEDKPALTKNSLWEIFDENFLWNFFQKLSSVPERKRHYLFRLAPTPSDGDVLLGEMTKTEKNLLFLFSQAKITARTFSSIHLKLPYWAMWASIEERAQADLGNLYYELRLTPNLKVVAGNFFQLKQCLLKSP